MSDKHSLEAISIAQGALRLRREAVKLEKDSITRQIRAVAALQAQADDLDALLVELDARIDALETDAAPVRVRVDIAKAQI